MKVLVGDVGGTNLRLGTFVNGGLCDIETRRTKNQPLFDEALASYVDRLGPFDCVGLAVAGPLVNQGITMTNVSITVDENTLSKRLGCPVRLMNDFEAQARAMSHIGPEYQVPLGPVFKKAPGHCVVLGAGTGLGEALLIWDGTQHVPVAGEGSHGRFAPKTPREVELLGALTERWPEHVSVERVVSGPGLVSAYEALKGSLPHLPEMGPVPTPVMIAKLGLEGRCPVCTEVVDIFIRTLADEAASLALKCNAQVVYLSGGILPRMLEKLNTDFRPMFESKGRYRGLMEQMTVYVVTHPHIGLLGAAHGAMTGR